MTRLVVLGVGLAILSSCSGAGKPPPSWSKEPISRAHYCPPGAETPQPLAARPQADIEHGLSAINHDVAACRREALYRNPGAFGSMKVRFWITPQGDVSNACIAEATFDDEPMAECMMRAVSAVRVEPALGFQAASKQYWFKLETASNRPKQLASPGDRGLPSSGGWWWL